MWLRGGREWQTAVWQHMLACACVRLKLPGIVHDVPLPLHSDFTPRVALRLAALSFAALRLATLSLVHPHIIVAMAKVSSREAKTALNAATSMAEVFRDAGELSRQREIKFVCEQLRNNEDLLFRLSGYLKDDSVVALLDGRMHATVQQYDRGLKLWKRLKANRSVAPGLEEVGTCPGGHGIFDLPLARGVGLEIKSDCPEGLNTNGQPAPNAKLLGGRP